MNSDRLKKMFDEQDDDDEYLQFDRIPEADRLHPSQGLCGVLKIASLLKDPAKWEHHAEHDILYLADAYLLKKLTPDDVRYLRRCGVHYDDEGDCLAHFC